MANYLFIKNRFRGKGLAIDNGQWIINNHYYCRLGWQRSKLWIVEYISFKRNPTFFTRF